MPPTWSHQFTITLCSSRLQLLVSVRQTSKRRLIWTREEAAPNSEAQRCLTHQAPWKRPNKPVILQHLSHLKWWSINYLNPSSRLRSPLRVLAWRNLSRTHVFKSRSLLRRSNQSWLQQGQAPQGSWQIKWRGRWAPGTWLRRQCHSPQIQQR